MWAGWDRRFACQAASVTNRRAFVTTSWDDGHPLDVRLAALLAKYGVLGTFYVPVRYNQFPVMSRDQLQAVRSMGMEIGSHTVTHPKLTRLPRADALQELVGSKRHFEDMVDDEIVSFCYPEGEFNARTRSLVMEAGYKLARTTACFRIDSDFDPFHMPVSFQFFPHSRVEYTVQSRERRQCQRPAELGQAVANWRAIRSLFWNCSSSTFWRTAACCTYGGIPGRSRNGISGRIWRTRSGALQTLER